MTKKQTALLEPDIAEDTPAENAPVVPTHADIATQLDALIVAVATWPSTLTVMHQQALTHHLAHARRIIGQPR